jgi:2-phospho-L-lactate transferase/gluconeogenesis factor (CofD/UPF0052 family)
VVDAIETSKAELLQVVNLVTKPGHTDNWTVQDYASELERYLINRRLDYVLYNTLTPTADMLKQYAHDGEYPVLCKKSNGDLKAKFVGADLISLFKGEINKHDPLAVERTLIRHDPIILAKAIKQLI